MNEVEKLRVLLPHWIEHNSGHESECIQWAGTAKKAGLDSVAGAIERAVQAMKEANDHLGKALQEAGGPLEGHHHHDHQHHH